MSDKNKKTAPNNEVSSRRTASLASAVLRNPNSTKIMKSIAGAVLTQRPDKSK
jgi:hypothetical protein